MVLCGMGTLYIAIGLINSLSLVGTVDKIPIYTFQSARVSEIQ